MSNYIHGAYGKPKGINTTQRIVGKSAYEIAVEHGFVGSEEEWLESLKGKSAYEVAVDLGYEGTADEWVESIGLAMGIDLADELTDLKDDLNDLEEAVGTTSDETISLTGLQQDNKFWNSEGLNAVLSSYNTYRAYSIDVNAYDKYDVTIWQMSSLKQHPVLLVDNDLKIISEYRDDGISQGGTAAGMAHFVFVVPATAAKMLLTTRTSEVPTVVKKGGLNSLPLEILRIDAIEADVANLENATDDLQSAIGYEDIPDVNIDISGLKNPDHFWNSEGTTAVLSSYNTYCLYDAISVEAGDDYRVSIHVMSSTKQHAVLLTDDNLNIIDSYGQGSGTSTSDSVYEMTIPATATKMLLTTHNNYTPTVIKLGSGRQLHSVQDIIDSVDDMKAVLAGKTVAVIGDSISTNGDAGTDPNVPELTITEDDVGIELSAYLTYYDIQAELTLGGHTFTSSEIGTEVTFTPIAEDVGKSIGLPNNYNPNSTTVWWEVMQTELGNITVPVCWSGASITSHEGTSDAYKTSYAWHDAQIRKCGIRTPGSMVRTSPDVIIIYRGTNDFSHTSYTKLTEGYFDNVNWQYPETDVVADGYGYLEGIALTIKKLREAYPDATIYLCTLNVFKRINYAHFPTNNGINTLPDYNNAIRKAADFFGCGLIEFDKDGITFENCYSGGYITDSSTIPTHPSDKGHAVMGRKAIADIRASYASLT